MKATDRRFIAGVAVILCLAGMWSMHDFSKNRNLNGINIMGVASREIPADTVQFRITLIGTGTTKAIRKELAFKRLEEVKNFVEGASFTNSNYDGRRVFDTDQCYFWGTEKEYPCTRMSLNLQFTGNISEKLKTFIEKTDDLDWIDIEDKRLIVGENNPQVKELISEANKDAETHAKEVASQLWVKLGKLIVYSENGFAPEYREYGVANRSFFEDEEGASENSWVFVRVNTYHTYAID